MKRTPPKPDAAPTLLPLSVVDVDLIRFEKNLLQIGFFGANDAREKNRTTRRIEQVVFRNGHKIKVAAEFRGSEQLGLPSTTDRDKFIALLKIISEDRPENGVIANPVRFSGYRLIQELGLSRNGDIYDEILRWGKRMTDTTITSEQVIYFAAKKVYSDEVLHVFRSFRRTGNAKLDGGERQEHYEVMLEDWLLENLNQRYVIPEDFNAYKQLTRPTAKGIFGNLHLWFHASHGRTVEKDYGELCNLLNIQTYPHLSKIKSTMGLALNELVAIKYIGSWAVVPMTSKQGYKIVLTPGDVLLGLLEMQGGERRLSGGGGGREGKAAPEALEPLLRHGITPVRAESLLERFGEARVADTVEYLEEQMRAGAGRRRAVANPAGLIISSLENELPLPAGFLGSRQKQELEHAAVEERAAMDARLEREQAYGRWVENEVQKELEGRFTAAELAERVRLTTAERSRDDEVFRRVPLRNRTALALRLLQKEVRASLDLPEFEEWLKVHQQGLLFPGV